MDQFIYLSSDVKQLDIKNFIYAKHTPYEYAARQGCLNIVQWFVDGIKEDNPYANFSQLNNLINPTDQVNDSNTPFHLAAEKGRINVVEFFCNELTNVENLNRYGVTPLYLASKNGHDDVVELIVNTIKKKNKSFVVPQFHSCEQCGAYFYKSDDMKKHFIICEKLLYGDHAPKKPVEKSEESILKFDSESKKWMVEQKRSIGRSFAKYPGSPTKDREAYHFFSKRGAGHKCYKCDKIFNHMGKLKRHFETVHLGPQTFKCDAGCDKSFGHISMLKAHVERFHGEIQHHNCEYCGKTFGRFAHLKMHIRNIHEIKEGRY